MSVEIVALYLSHFLMLLQYHSYQHLQIFVFIIFYLIE